MSEVVIGGDLLGDILATKLEIGNITVTGNIGAPGNFVTITAGKDGTTNQEFNSIGTIQASAIWANITANALDRGDIARVITTSGDFVGSLTTFSIQGALAGETALDIAGNLDADIFVEGSVKQPIVIGGILPAGRIIRIGGDLKADPGTDFDIDFAMANGLQGQIVINASNTGKLWSGMIRVGGPDENPITLLPTPSYDNLPSTIGGGAVGLGPFKFHAKACEPDHQAIIIVPGTPAPSVAKMEFYGELIDNSGANEPVKVERTSSIGPPPLDPVDVTSNYTITVSGRIVTITPKSGHSFGPNFKYTITPVAGRLSSKDVDGTPDVDLTAYVFNVRTGL